MQLIENYLNNGTKKIIFDKNEVIIKELWWQKKHLMFTATGYSKKIPTEYMVQWNKKYYRVYCACFSNNGTCYIISKKESIIVDFNF